MFLAFSLGDIVTVPFGYLLSFLYDITTNYGVALIIFAIIVKLVLLPATAKGKRSTMKMSRLTPRIEAINVQKTQEAVELVLPGGGVGTDNLSAHEPLRAALKEANAKGVLIAAICAAPMVLGRSGLLEGRKATCYPGCESDLFGAEYTSASVEECGNIITACGPGVSFDFGFAIVARLCEEGTVATLRSQMQFGK